MTILEEYLNETKDARYDISRILLQENRRVIFRILLVMSLISCIGFAIAPDWTTFVVLFSALWAVVGALFVGVGFFVLPLVSIIFLRVIGCILSLLYFE